jgi:hypothetical protein
MRDSSGLGLQNPDTNVFPDGTGVTSETTITVTQQGSLLCSTRRFPRARAPSR